MSRLRTDRRLPIAIGFIVASLAAAGCSSTADLQAVAAYGQAAAGARSSFADVASDFAGSCRRRRELMLAPRELASTQIEPAPVFPTAPAAKPTPTPTVTAVPAPSPAFRDSRCAEAVAVSADWNAGNGVVLGYVQKLGEIAHLDAAPTFAPLGSALVAPGILNASQNKSFTAVANVLSQQLVAGDQRRLIADTVRSVDPSFRTAIESLKTVDALYGDVLDAEFNETFAYYHCLIASELTSPGPARAPAAPHGGPCPSEGIPATITPELRARILEQRRSFDETLKAINRRRASTVAYAAVLDGLEHTHERLFDATERGATIGDYLGLLRSNVLPLSDSVETLRETVR